MNVKLSQTCFTFKSLTSKPYNLQSQQPLSKSKNFEFRLNYYGRSGFTATFFENQSQANALKPQYSCRIIREDFLIHQSKFFPLLCSRPVYLTGDKLSIGVLLMSIIQIEAFKFQTILLPWLFLYCYTEFLTSSSKTICAFLSRVPCTIY